MAMTFSASVSPAIFFLVYRFTSACVAFCLLIVLAVIAIYIGIQNYRKGLRDNEYIKPVGSFVVLWLLLSVFTLVDLQSGGRLYFSANSYDLTTRVSIVNAISRTGVPPINPSYYPGQPVLLNFLYYYWYILVSLVEQVGGSLVSAYAAMIASISWAGILLFASLATYLRVRDNQPSQQSWKKSFIAIQLITVGGLDAVMLIIIMASFGFHLEKLPFLALFEGWNMPIMSWMNALAWVPHHLTAALACMTAMLLTTQNMNGKFLERISQSIFVGLAFASAFGLSVWVMFVFAIFWLVWAAALLFWERKYQQVGFMILGGVFSLIFVSPFIWGILSDVGRGASSNGELPVSLYIRPFMITSLLDMFPKPVIHILDFLFLPLNYLFELGFFFLIAAIWFQDFYRQNRELNPIYWAESLLFVVSFIVLSFVYSTIIVINDLGIRGWLPVQFLLLVWASDVISRVVGREKWISAKLILGIWGDKKIGLALSVMLIIGYLTMGLEFFSLRAWSFLVDTGGIGVPNGLSPDNHLGERTYSARQAYDYLRDHVPPDVVTQNNPLEFLDRPSGLYGTHQMVISDRSAYGISDDVFDKFIQEIGVIFTAQNVSDWQSIDGVCSLHSIDVLIFKDTDPVWDSLNALKKQRFPLYENMYYAVYTCGNYSNQ
jgi:hypothetical protein